MRKIIIEIKKMLRREYKMNGIQATSIIADAFRILPQEGATPKDLAQIAIRLANSGIY